VALWWIWRHSSDAFDVDYDGSRKRKRLARSSGVSDSLWPGKISWDEVKDFVKPHVSMPPAGQKHMPADIEGDGGGLENPSQKARVLGEKRSASEEGKETGGFAPL